jgi:hypothetical protein
VALVRLAQQVANLFRKDVGIRHGEARWVASDGEA